MAGRERNAIVFSGCGTSGRLAWLCARGLNTLLAPHNTHAPAFRFLISGGCQSIVISNELPEDDPHAGAADLAAITAGCTRVLFIGARPCQVAGRDAVQASRAGCPRRMSPGRWTGACSSRTAQRRSLASIPCGWPATRPSSAGTAPAAMSAASCHARAPLMHALTGVHGAGGERRARVGAEPRGGSGARHRLVAHEGRLGHQDHARLHRARRSAALHGCYL